MTHAGGPETSAHYPGHPQQKNFITFARPPELPGFLRRPRNPQSASPRLEVAYLRRDPIIAIIGRGLSFTALANRYRPPPGVVADPHLVSGPRYTHSRKRCLPPMPHLLRGRTPFPAALRWQAPRPESLPSLPLNITGLLCYLPARLHSPRPLRSRLVSGHFAGDSKGKFLLARADGLILTHFAVGPEPFFGLRV